RMMIGKVDDFSVVESALGHDFRVPVCGPSFVHDLRLRLRGEVIRLLANDPENIALPILEGGVFEEKQKHILLRIFGKTAPFLAIVFELLLLMLQEFTWI